MAGQIYSDVRVLDLSWYISGPYCTKMFADYGADVIKVEKPREGDPVRMIGPFLDDDPHPEKSLLFSHLNLNKKSITLNLKSETGKEITKNLVKQADIIVESFRPGVLDRLGLGYESLKRINPKVVMTSISNFGQTGPYREFKMSELILNGFHAMIHVGLPDRHPLKKGGHVCLYQAGLNASLATSAAFWVCEEQGIGQHVDVSLLETMIGDADRKTVDLQYWAYSGHGLYTSRTDPASWQGRNIIPTGVFPCKDGFIISLALLAHWPRFVQLMKRPELEKLRFPEDMFDMDIKGQVDAIWYEWLSERTKKEVMEESQAVKWFVTVVHSPKDVLEDPHFKERGFWVEVEHPITGKQTYPGAPVKVGEESWQVNRPAPMLGQHNMEIYVDELGYTRGDIDRFKNDGII